MARCLRRDPNCVDVILYGMTRSLFGCLKQRADIDIKADISKCRGNHFCAAIMAVLTQFNHQQSRPAAFFLGGAPGFILDAGKLFITFVGRTINAAD